ncbi:MAG: hypothetical protein HY876_00500, partial [Coriobacteriales bacterium]|nr:hypothetical protein [Coriobacteriales bacterium]
MELRDYVRVLRAHLSLIVAATLVCALSALGVSLLQPKVYEGKAEVLISERDTGAALLGQLLSEFSNQPERQLQTQVQLMKLRPLARKTINELNLQTTPEQL